MNLKNGLVSINFIFLVVNLLPAQAPLDSKLEIEFDRKQVFEEVSDNIVEHFFDTSFSEEKWLVRTKEFRRKAIASKTHDAFATTVNELLQTLGASHTYYFSRLNPKRYQLLGIMHRAFEGKGNDLFFYEGIGLDTRELDGGTFVTSVYDGMPAATAGLKFGDQIFSVDSRPFHPILSFTGKTGSGVEIELKRDGKNRIVNVQVKKIDGRTMFENALLSSARVIKYEGKQIGYVHIWSYAGAKYQEQLRSLILRGKLSQCDALILDLRDGWGGADINYLNLFRPTIANIQTSSRNQPPQNYSGVWRKPVTLITNERSTSGKELFAYGFKKLKLGKIVGETTAGAVVAGRCFLLSNGDALYLAVTDIKVDGSRLEKNGVEPDMKISRQIRGSTDSDPQLKRAIEVSAAVSRK